MTDGVSGRWQQNPTGVVGWTWVAFDRDRRFGCLVSSLNIPPSCPKLSSCVRSHTLVRFCLLRLSLIMTPCPKWSAYPLNRPMVVPFLPVPVFFKLFFAIFNPVLLVEDQREHAKHIDVVRRLANGMISNLPRSYMNQQSSSCCRIRNRHELLGLRAEALGDWGDENRQPGLGAAPSSIVSIGRPHVS